MGNRPEVAISLRKFNERRTVILEEITTNGLYTSLFGKLSGSYLTLIRYNFIEKLKRRFGHSLIIDFSHIYEIEEGIADEFIESVFMYNALGVSIIICGVSKEFQDFCDKIDEPKYNLSIAENLKLALNKVNRQKGFRE